MGCCSSKPERVTALAPLKPGTYLWRAQRMTKTPSGHPITNKVTRNLMTRADAQRILVDPTTPEDFRLVFGPPFNACNKLTAYLYLTGVGGLTKENITGIGITLIINATYEWPNIAPEGVECYRVPVDDGEVDDISVYFDEVSDKIEECAKNGGKTLVHCMAGASRSTTLVLAYLVKYERISLKNAFNSVKKRRETARPNIGFWEQLIKYEIRVKGQSSVRMIQHMVSGIGVTVPDFYQKDYPDFHKREIEKQINLKKAKLKDPNIRSKSQKQFNEQTLTYD